MVITDPSLNESRKFKEALIRVIDILAYLTVLYGGIGAIYALPLSVDMALRRFHWLIVVWIVFLIVGGSFGAIGRFSRVWIVELLGAGAGMIGSAIYFVILSAAALDGLTALVASSLVLCLGWLMLRRYVELQIFTSEPGEKSFAQRIAEILRRRTTNTVGLHN
jgi:hypothetical protein